MLIPNEVCATNTNLTAVTTALAGVTDAELESLIAATYGAPQTPLGLLVWIDGACDRELIRRRGFYYPVLLPAKAAISPSKDVVRIDAAEAMGATFARDPRNVARQILVAGELERIALKDCSHAMKRRLIG